MNTGQQKHRKPASTDVPSLSDPFSHRDTEAGLQPGFCRSNFLSRRTRGSPRAPRQGQGRLSYSPEETLVSDSSLEILKQYLI